MLNDEQRKRKISHERELRQEDIGREEGKKMMNEKDNLRLIK